MSNNLLKGKRGIIFGALNDQSIAWKVAERAVEEGATITLSNTPMAIRMVTCARNVLMMTLTMECWTRHWIFRLYRSIK